MMILSGHGAAMLMAVSISIAMKTTISHLRKAEQPQDKPEHTFGGRSFQRRWRDFLVGGWCVSHELKSGEKVSMRTVELCVVRNSICTRASSQYL